MSYTLDEIISEAKALDSRDHVYTVYRWNTGFMVLVSETESPIKVHKLKAVSRLRYLPGYETFRLALAGGRSYVLGL